jgi:hypothetical protein
MLRAGLAAERISIDTEVGRNAPSIAKSLIVSGNVGKVSPSVQNVACIGIRGCAF